MMHNYRLLEKDKEMLSSSITIWTILKSLFLVKISEVLIKKKPPVSVFYVMTKMIVICQVCVFANPGLLEAT